MKMNVNWDITSSNHDHCPQKHMTLLLSRLPDIAQPLEDGAVVSFEET